MISEKYSIKEIREKIEETAEKLFSEGTLSDKIDLAQKLASLPGLNLYFTELPWFIEVPGVGRISGLSENMYMAARDIHANLFIIQRSLPPEITVIIGVDEARLPSPYKNVKEKAE